MHNCQALHSVQGNTVGVSEFVLHIGMFSFEVKSYFQPFKKSVMFLFNVNAVL